MSKVKEHLWHEAEHDIELYFEPDPDTDMHISKMKTSKFLTKDDFEQPKERIDNHVKSFTGNGKPSALHTIY